MANPDPDPDPDAVTVADPDADVVAAIEGASAVPPHAAPVLVRVGVSLDPKEARCAMSALIGTGAASGG
jgi:hypothetical protein